MNTTSKNTFEWYGVKFLHKIVITGEPEENKIDEFFHDTKTFFEESILLVKAYSFDDAYHIAEIEAQKDNEIYKNKYGQTVKYKFYESIDCFHLFDPPKSGVEIYSTFFEMNQGEDEKILLDKRYNDCTVKELHLIRHK